MLSAIILWAAVGLLAWVYLGYPVVVAILARFAPWRPRQTDPQPSVSVAIAVHDEADAIAARIADVFAQDGSVRSGSSRS